MIQSIKKQKLPVVSVCMVTYNHEKFIDEALNGVLMQKCNFEIELILANDCSQDNTDEIIQNILKNHPRASFIKYIKQEKNIGMMPNFMHALENCKGKYVALCDGDDYWTDPAKLQKQVDYLELNKNCNICFHKVSIINKSNKHINDITEGRYLKINNPNPTIIDLLRVGNFIHTPSVVFRNNLDSLPFEFSYSSVGDYFLYILLTQQGYIKRLDERMAVYRGGVGNFSTISNLEMHNRILIYESCILSYLNKDDQKKILLKKHIENINNMEDILLKKHLSNDFLASNLSLKKYLNVLLKKINLYFKFNE